MAKASTFYLMKVKLELSIINLFICNSLLFIYEQIYCFAWRIGVNPVKK